jgi:hypothetical protein
MLTFAEAKTVCIPFGKHAHETIAHVGSDDEGLLYLDHLVGLHWVNAQYPRFKRALECYLADPSIAPRLDAAIQAAEESDHLER